MKKAHFLVLLAALIVAGCTSSQERPTTGTLEYYADSLFQANLDSSFIAGATVMVYKNGAALLDKSYGFASLELAVPMPDNAVFEIGSVTKQFTAAAILKLLEEEKLSLEDDITKYLEFDTRGRKVTIAQLLNHTSGIPSYTEIPEFWALSTERHGRDSLVRLVEQHDFLFEPGEAMIYNNSGYFFLGLIIEKVSGKSYEEYLNEEFFEPLGMTYSHYSSNMDVYPNKVYGYVLGRDGLKQKPFLDHTWPYAAGSLSSSSEDLLTWMKALHEKKLLSEELYTKMIQPEQLNNGTPIRYAMGLVHYSHFGHQVIGHGGGIHGFLSETRYFPEEDLYIICLVNTAGPKGAGFFAEALTWELLEKKEDAAQPVDIDVEALAGTYTGAARGRTLRLEVSALSNALIISIAGEEEADTLDTYIGNATWKQENDLYTFSEDVCTIDQIGGFYVLKKQ